MTSDHSETGAGGGKARQLPTIGTGWLAYSGAVLAALAGAGAAWGLFAVGVAKPQAALIPLPSVWLMLAALLGRGAGVRWLAAGTGAAVGFSLAGNLLLLLDVLARHRSWPVPAWCLADRGTVELLVLGQFPLALVVAVANAVGWWQRRQDRLADDEDAG